MTRLSRIIKLTRTIDGMSQSALAGQIGIPRSAIRRVELGKSIDAGVAAKIMVWLFEDEDADGTNTNEGMMP